MMGVGGQTKYVAHSRGLLYIRGTQALALEAYIYGNKVVVQLEHMIQYQRIYKQINIYQSVYRRPILLALAQDLAYVSHE